MRLLADFLYVSLSKPSPQNIFCEEYVCPFGITKTSIRMKNVSWLVYFIWVGLTSWVFWEGSHQLIPTVFGPIAPSMIFGLTAFLISQQSKFATLIGVLGAISIVVGVPILLIEASPPTTESVRYRVGAVTMDGWVSASTGSGTGSGHGGVNRWLTKTEDIPIRETKLESWLHAFESKRMRSGVIPIYFGASLILVAILGFRWAQKPC
jgi:hypothetical protein